MTQSVAAGRVERCEALRGFGAAVARCAAAGEKLVDYGVAHGGMGHRPPGGHVRIVAPVEGFEHWVADLSVRAPGGMTIGELQRRLAGEGQWLPLDADDDMTVGEVIAHNVSGPLRMLYGHCRDLLLGLRYVDAAGTLITVGGRTVKNVAGYDVTRLMVGSLHTLGLIGDANLRTAAIPERVVRVSWGGLDPAGLDGRMTALLTCDASPMYVEWRVRAGRSVLHVGYCGTPRGCEAQLEALRALGLGGDEIERASGDLTGDQLARSASRAWRRTATAHVRVIVPPAATGRTLRALQELDPAPRFIDALPAHGVIDVGGEASVEESVTWDARIAGVIGPVGGVVAWVRRPGDTDRIAPFSPPQSDWAMLAKIKRTMDPTDTFNPGRFP